MYTALPDNIVDILISKEYPREIYAEMPAYSAMQSLHTQSYSDRRYYNQNLHLMKTMPRSISPSTILLQSIPRDLEVSDSRSEPWIDPSQLPPEKIFGNYRHNYQNP